MPEKSLTIAAYAAGASLAAATLVYVLGPTFFLDEVDANSQAKKRLAIGLTNNANDCFINSTLQALGSLPTLRLYLIRELHQRQLDGKDVYLALAHANEEKDQSMKGAKPEWLQLSLQTGVLTSALKDILDALNERPIARKTITAQPFITAVEHAFKTRVSRYQQDAQEFLQLVMERLADEHRAAIQARRRAGKIDSVLSKQEAINEEEDTLVQAASKLELAGDDTVDSEAVEVQPLHPREAQRDRSPESDLPFEGKLSSQLECSTCHFKPKSATTNFVTLTLNVPHNATSTSLDACLDGMLKIEHIDDFRCDWCRLEHALQLVARQLTKTTLSADNRSALEAYQVRIQETMNTDPEHPPKDLQLPDSASSPKRRITRYMRISLFPKVLTIHLSRSVWDGGSTSSKNTAKVSFGETLQLGSLLDRKTYRLLSVITHKGGHNSGHYETFRRQWLPPSVVIDEKIGAHEERAGSTLDSPRFSVLDDELETGEQDQTSSEPIASAQEAASPSVTATQLPPTKSHSSNAAASRFMASQSPRLKATSHAKLADRRRKAQDRWWRISDDKVKECKLADVVGMQKEVYLLFYELVVP